MDILDLTLNLKAPNLRTNSRVKKTVKMMLSESRNVVYSWRSMVVVIMIMVMVIMTRMEIGIIDRSDLDGRY